MAVLTDKDIPPGGEGKIEVTFDSKHKKGQQKKTITVESNDPKKPKATLFMTGLVEVQFGFNRTNLNIGRIRKGEPFSKTVVLLLKDASKKNLLEVSTQSPKIMVNTVKSSQNQDGQIEVNITLKQDVQAGKLNEKIIAKLSDSSYPASNLRITGTVIGNVDVIPGIVRFSIDTSLSFAEQPELTVKVVSAKEGFKFRMLKVEDPRNRLTFQIDTLVVDEKFEIRIKPHEDVVSKRKNLSGEIKIYTDDTAQPEISIYYNVLFPRQRR